MRIPTADLVPITVRLTPDAIKALRWIIANERKTQQRAVDEAILAACREGMRRRAKEAEGFGKP